MGNEPHLTYLAGGGWPPTKKPCTRCETPFFSGPYEREQPCSFGSRPFQTAKEAHPQVRPNPLPGDYPNSQKSLKVTRGCSIIITSGEVKQRTNTASSPSRAPSRPVSLMGSARRKSPPKRPSPSEGLCLAPSPLARTTIASLQDPTGFCMPSNVPFTGLDSPVESCRNYRGGQERKEEAQKSSKDNGPLAGPQPFPPSSGVS